MSGLEESKTENGISEVTEEIPKNRCYTELGVRNLAAAFLFLSDDVARQTKKSQKHAVSFLSLFISRQIEKRQSEALHLWRAATLRDPSLKESQSPTKVVTHINILMDTLTARTAEVTSVLDRYVGYHKIEKSYVADFNLQSLILKGSGQSHNVSKADDGF